MKFSGKVGNGPVNKCLNFGGDPDHRLDTGLVYQIHHYWEIRKVANVHKSAGHTDSPDGGTGKTSLAEVCTVPVLLVFKLICSLHQVIRLSSCKNVNK